MHHRARAEDSRILETGRIGTRIAIALAVLCWTQAAAAIVRDLGRTEADALTPRISTHRFGSVGWITVGCTATPVAPDTLISAAHCFQEMDGSPIANAPLHNFRIDYQDRPDVVAPLRGVTIHPHYPMCPSHPCSGGLCKPSGCFAADLAIVRLQQDLPSYVATYPLASFSAPPVGATVAQVGFGRTGTGPTGGTEFSWSRRYGFNRITGVSRYNAALQTVFDASGLTGPCTGKSCFLDTAGWFRVREVSVAPGDSGGPMFYNPVRDLQANPPTLPITVKLLPDEEYLVGVASHGGTAYGSIAGHTFVGNYLSWIQLNDSRVQVLSQGAPMVPLADAPVDLVEATALPESPMDCQDGFDNDGDGLVDAGDPGCTDPLDPTETSLDLACDDGLDNDRDGAVDTGDAACTHPGMPLEDPACADGIDNDGDGRADFDGGAVGGSPDPECVDRPWRPTESASRCGLGFELAALIPALASARARLRRRARLRG